MNYAGIDIGSRTIEVVVVNSSGEIICSLASDTGFDPIAESLKMFYAIEEKGVKYESIMATGYGRTLFEIAYANLDPISNFNKLTLINNCSTVTEIKAHARGVAAFFPDAATILDIGGQDSKAIALNENGRVKKFEMNDRCAAGTGKFLEIMARTLGFTIDDFGKEALLAQNDLTINSMCTVFAESEVTSLIAKGSDRREIAKGLHISVMKRAASMISRVRNIESSIIRPDKITGQSVKADAKDDFIVFTGGVAKNECMVKLISEKLGCDVLVPDNPQTIGAFGAALIALEQQSKDRV
ncbi:MAG: 3-hydroxyacyl-ACP dehydratase [Desulfamplus sp.]|nr:3-hydroxyacyl-ACP dehydratase [Desulfamplus sp.]